jgi:hypothetical protein
LVTFVKVQLNRLLAFSPKTIIVSEQKAYSGSGGSLTVGNAVVVGDSIGKVGASV